MVKNSLVSKLIFHTGRLNGRRDRVPGDCRFSASGGKCLGTVPVGCICNQQYRAIFRQYHMKVVPENGNWYKFEGMADGEFDRLYGDDILCAVARVPPWCELKRRYNRQATDGLTHASGCVPRPGLLTSFGLAVIHRWPFSCHPLYMVYIIRHGHLTMALLCSAWLFLPGFFFLLPALGPSDRLQHLFPYQEGGKASMDKLPWRQVFSRQVHGAQAHLL